MTPEITVVVPYHNERETIRFTLERIAAQTLPAAAAIFVNSSSTDDTPAIVDEWIASHGARTATRFFNVSAGTTTPGSSKNVGIRRAATEWIAFMDCGQDFAEDWLEQQHRYAGEHGLDLVSGTVYLTGRNWVDRCAIAQTYGYRRYRPCVPGTLIRSTVFERSGLFAENRRAGYDAAWLSKIRTLGIARGVNEQASIEYLGTNFAATLPQAFRKSALYAKPSVGLPGYRVPYAYAALSLAAPVILLAAPRAAAALFAAYWLARSFAIPYLKSGGAAFFRENPLVALLGGGLVGLAIDSGRVIGTWLGIVEYHLRGSARRS